MKTPFAIFVFFVLCSPLIWAQRECSYVLNLQSNPSGTAESTLQQTSEITDFELFSDSLILHTDSNYLNRSIDFILDGSLSNDVFVGLSGEKKENQLGFRIFDNKAFLTIGEFVIQGPFNGELIDGSPILISNLLQDITACKLACTGNQISFFINEALVHKSCLPFDGLSLFHQVTAKASVDVLINLTLNEW